MNLNDIKFYTLVWENSDVAGIEVFLWLLLSFYEKKLGFTICKAEQPLQGMELQEKQAQKIKAYRNLLQKNLQLKGVC